ncbi:peptidoglycan DD-metalloendopeptidase family protein [Massilia scottii]|uniref:peptidoglycan DD-metalloendopeptidase family protein n=1 Tax=Massilia scottii TaxID=3057166 RepID=UPI002796AF6E|nr:peptidoglycan DD-metalloendopeptidase family protein [Massilia sp. CCM 9029]MDQ1833587.1 peptidoglycan DD-metalloendopeptidase family protein [Massilia sp. CCM 9029]
MSIPSITELSLLKCLWKQHPLSARAIHQHAEEELHWSFSSTRKTLDRMLEKGMISQHSLHGVNVYTAVLEAGNTLQQRKRYAAALIAQFKMQHTSPAYAAMAFGGQLRDCVSARVALLRDGIAFHSHGAVRAASGCLLIALLLASVVLQPAFALRAVDTSPHPVNPAAESLPQWLAPLQRMHITSYFGTVRTAGATPHGGIDLAARLGTPIMAPASGTVTASTDLYQGEARYGEVIAIEHAGGLRSVYAHLNQRSVKVGEAVAKGQLIGHTGATGRVSGPHLHLEIHRNNIKLDPELLLGSQDGTDSANNARDTQRSR